MHDSLLPLSDWILQVREATSSNRMSVGFIGAGQLAHALVKGFTAAGEATFFFVTDVKSYSSDFGLNNNKKCLHGYFLNALSIVIYLKLLFFFLQFFCSMY